jgi:hypothetical protein
VSARRDRAAELAARAAAVANADTSATPDLRTSEPTEVHNEPAPARPRAARTRTTPTAPDAAPAATAPRTKPVRVTVELSPIEHRKLRKLCDRFIDELDLAEVARAEIFRALLNLADQDPQLADRLAQELRRTGGTRRR